MIKVCLAILITACLATLSEPCPYAYSLCFEQGSVLKSTGVNLHAILYSSSVSFGTGMEWAILSGFARNQQIQNE